MFYSEISNSSMEEINYADFAPISFNDMESDGGSVTSGDVNATSGGGSPTSGEDDMTSGAAMAFLDFLEQKLYPPRTTILVLKLEDTLELLRKVGKMCVGDVWLGMSYCRPFLCLLSGCSNVKSSYSNSFENRVLVNFIYRCIPDHRKSGVTWKGWGGTRRAGKAVRWNSLLMVMLVIVRFGAVYQCGGLKLGCSSAKTHNRSLLSIDDKISFKLHIQYTQQ